MKLNIRRVFSLILLAGLLPMILVGCAGWTPPAGTTITVNGDSDSNITGTVSVPVSTNITIGGTVTGNPETGAVGGGLVVTFTKAPSDATVAAMLEAGMAAVGNGKSSALVYYLPVWRHEDLKQEAALEAALREGATVQRPASVKREDVKREGARGVATLRANHFMTVGKVTYWNVAAAPCATALAGPTPIGGGWVMVPPGTWRISKTLTILATVN